MKLFLKISIACMSIALIFSLFNSWNFADTFQRKPVLVIDPGHGGIDGGASGKNNIPEKNINLSIGLKLANMATSNGWKVVLTRDIDQGLGGDDGSIRSQKMKDLVERKNIIDETKPDVVISIHLNSFPQDSSCKGSQTFYPADQEEPLKEKSKLLCESIQAQLIQGLKLEKERKPMKKNNVYLFKKPSCPIALVECGFLSNPEEESLLQDDQYQYQIAASIFKGVEQYNRQINGNKSTLDAKNIIISSFSNFGKQ